MTTTMDTTCKCSCPPLSSSFPAANKKRCTDDEIVQGVRDYGYVGLKCCERGHAMAPSAASG